MNLLDTENQKASCNYLRAAAFFTVLFAAVVLRAFLAVVLRAVVLRAVFLEALFLAMIISPCLFNCIGSHFFFTYPLQLKYTKLFINLKFIF